MSVCIHAPYPLLLLFPSNGSIKTAAASYYGPPHKDATPHHYRGHTNSFLRLPRMGYGPQAGGRLRVGVTRFRPFDSFQDDAVDVAGPLLGDQAIPDIAGYQLRISLRRFPVPAPAGQTQYDPLPCLYVLLAFGVEFPAIRGAHPSGPSGRTSLYAPGGAAGTVVHGGEDPGDVGADPDLHLLPEAASTVAGTFGVGTELALMHHYGGDALYHLGGDAADAAREGRSR